MNKFTRFSWTNSRHPQRSVLFWALVGGACAGGNPASAAQLDEIVVTAQKQAQALGDVPIAIVSVSGEEMRESGLDSLEDLSVNVPNFTFSEAASGSDNIFMRGVGSGINYGFEQAVGQVIDGVFYGRSRFGRGAFLDLERVEILKGPQGALLGKNTTAGAINITTAKPTDELFARVQASYFFEGSEGSEVDAAVSGPLGDSVRGRIALRYEDRDGFVENVITNRDEQKSKQLDLRGTLQMDLSDAVSATLMYQIGDSDKTGRVGQLSQCGALLRNFDPDGPGPAPAGALFNQLVNAGEDCTLNYSHTVVNRRGAPVPQQFNTEYEMGVLTLEWSLGDLTLTSLTGMADYEFLDDFDADWTPVTLAGVVTTEDYSQWSQELRLNGPITDRVDFIAGAYYLKTDQETDFRRDFVLLPPPLTPSGNLISTRQDAETYALFGQVTFALSDTFDLIVGARYTDESKDVRQDQTPTALFTNDPIVLIPPAGPAAGLHSIAASRSESDFSPNVALQWYPRDGVMTYLKAAKGFKGGGYDFQNDAPQATAAAKLEFDNEDVTSYEAGAKLSLLDGAAEFNIALFRSEFSDLQVSTLDSISITFNVGNAASATTQGIEADFRWAVTERLKLSGAVALLDAEYDSFPGAPCSATALLSQTCAGSTDLAGKELPFSPKLSGFFSADYRAPLTSGMDFSVKVQATYSDDFALVLDLDEALFQRSYVKYDARLALSASDDRWEVALLGKNLGDKTTRSFGNDALGGPFMLGTFFSHVDAPRTLAVQGLFRF